MKQALILALFMMLVIIVASVFSSKAIVAKPYYYNQYTYDDLETLYELSKEQEVKMEAASAMAEAACILDHKEIAEIAYREYYKAEKTFSKYNVAYIDLREHWLLKEIAYPVATYIWKFLIDKGYSKIVAAAIMGNIMVEVGGFTLDIEYDNYTGTYYGICQWSSKYYPDIHGASLEEQCEYLINTIEKEFAEFGYLYRNNFTYNDFIQMQDIEQAALAFAVCYERCETSSYTIRQRCSINAYSYFIG